MGGEKFDSTHPEGYLFGENSDLNFLGNRPVVVGTGACGAGGEEAAWGWGGHVGPGVPLPKMVVPLCVTGVHGMRLLVVTAQGQSHPSVPGVA